MNKRIHIFLLLVGITSFHSLGFARAESTTSMKSADLNFTVDVFPWLKENGLTTMKTASEFRPKDTITRGEAAKFLTNFAKLIGLETTNSDCNFSDTANYDPSLKPFTIEACKYGLFRGSAGKFLPKNSITEAQALAVIGRSLYGMQDENTSPWYSEYFAIGGEHGLISSESLASVNTTNITREKLGTWLYQASQVDASGGTDTIIYETDVDGPSDCSSFEKYDSKRKVCSYECINEVECKTIESQIDAELNGWSESLDGATRDEPTAGGEATSTNSKVVYSVNPGEKITKVSGSDTSEYQSLWKEVADLSPDTLSDSYIENFEVYEDPKSDVIAYVSDDDGNGKWKMSINLPTHKLSDTKEQKATLIHELSHIITLNVAQFMTPTGVCPNYETDEGCTKSDAYLNNFVKKFWGTQKTATYSESNFVSEYASSSPEEDIAESFAFYVLGSNHSDVSIREQKMNFWNHYPEIIKIRSDMRNVLASEIIRAKKLSK